MNFYELISGRESIRSYDPEKKIPREILNRILSAGNLAPSAANRQPWEFLLVSSNEMLSKVRPCYKSEWFQSAPNILIVKGNRSHAWARPSSSYNSLETDLTIAMDHMILAAEYEGVGTCWIAAFSPEILRKALGLTPDEEVFTITPLGYPVKGFKKSGRKIRKSFDEVVKFI